jgi:hypothetical protein
MDTNGLTKSEKPNKKFQLVKEISPSEASDVIMSLIDEKIHQKQQNSKLGTKPQK